jgi:hypothetical protein
LQALRQAEAAPVVATPATPQEIAKKKQAEKEAKKIKAAAAPAPAPANVSAPPTKEQRLADLLRRYQADEITPYQYHMERAKIIAEP